MSLTLFQLVVSLLKTLLQFLPLYWKNNFILQYYEVPLWPRCAACGSLVPSPSIEPGLHE